MNRTGKQGNKIMKKSATLKSSASTSTAEPQQAIEMEVIENPSESVSENSVLARPLLTWPPQYSLDELLAKLVPLLLVGSEFFILGFVAVDPRRPQLLYSVLPPEWQNLWSFLILLTVEALCLFVVFSTAGFTLVTQVLFSLLQQMSVRIKANEPSTQENFGIGARDIEREMWILGQILEEMGEFVVLIELFNRAFPLPIFLWKIWSLSNAILFYFFVIRHSQDFPFLADFIGYCTIALTLTYTIMYEKAFSIPGKMEELKNEFLLTAQKTTSTSNSNGNKSLRADMKREVKRIHGVGIKVGSFNQMERQSTPNFIDCSEKRRHAPRDN